MMRCNPMSNYGGYPTAEQALDEVVNRHVKGQAPVAIYLFGSRARGDALTDSSSQPPCRRRRQRGRVSFRWVVV